ncbi:MAG: hypothetical protein EOO51_10075 [Flavobacterium sp.]|nr:MAG: hypothetical protein EOO51_10075 [Flavobacterium sp.]
MKKLLALITLFFAFALTANAQDRKPNPEEAAKIDAARMAEFLGLKGTQSDEFITLFVLKHQTLSDPKMSDQRKAEMSRITEEKIRASLTPEQLRKLEQNPEVFSSLTGAPVKGPKDKK